MTLLANYINNYKTVILATFRRTILQSLTTDKSILRIGKSDVYRTNSQDLYQPDALLKADEPGTSAFQTERRARARGTVERDRCVACAEHCAARGTDAPAPC